MKVMIDLLLGGPGETPQTAAETVNFIKKHRARLCRGIARHPSLSRHGHGGRPETARAA